MLLMKFLYQFPLPKINITFFFSFFLWGGGGGGGGGREGGGWNICFDEVEDSYEDPPHHLPFLQFGAVSELRVKIPLLPTTHPNHHLFITVFFNYSIIYVSL